MMQQEHRKSAIESETFLLAHSTNTEKGVRIFIYFLYKKTVSASLKRECWIFGLPFEMHPLCDMTQLILSGHKAHLLWSQE